MNAKSTSEMRLGGSTKKNSSRQTFKLTPLSQTELSATFLQKNFKYGASWKAQITSYLVKDGFCEGNQFVPNLQKIASKSRQVNAARKLSTNDYECTSHRPFEKEDVECKVGVGAPRIWQRT